MSSSLNQTASWWTDQCLLIVETIPDLCFPSICCEPCINTINPVVKWISPSSLYVISIKNYSCRTCFCVHVLLLPPWQRHRHWSLMSYGILIIGSVALKPLSVKKVVFLEVLCIPPDAEAVEKTANLWNRANITPVVVLNQLVSDRLVFYQLSFGLALSIDSD